MMAAEADIAKTENHKILLVDDVELFIELEKTFFRREQFLIFTAINGEEALRIARHENPDLIFLDLYLEGPRGDEVCRQLKADSRTAAIPVVMVVKADATADQQLCRQAGCDELLYKPLKREEFLRISRQMLLLTERAAPRIETRVQVNYGLRQERLLQHYTVNVGIGGLFLATQALLSINTRISLQLELSDGQPPICCTGRVAWLNHPDWVKKPQLPHGMGIEFLDMNDSDRQRLQRHLNGTDLPGD